MLASLSSWLHADDEPAATDEAAYPGTAASPEPCVHDGSAAAPASATASPESAASASASASVPPPPPIDALLGRSVGGLGGQKLRFRPQLFWQEVRSRCTRLRLWHMGLQPGHIKLPPEPTSACIRRCCPST